MTAKSKTMTLPTSALVTSTPKAVLLRLTDEITFWYPRSLIRHDRYGYHLTIIHGMVTELRHGNAKESCLTEELTGLLRASKTIEKSPGWKPLHDHDADRHLRAIAAE